MSCSVELSMKSFITSGPDLGLMCLHMLLYLSVVLFWPSRVLLLDSIYCIEITGCIANC